MKKMWVLAIILILGHSVQAQNVSRDERTITISMTAQELLPADLIIFNINVNAEGRTPRDAFNKHKELEHVLASALKEFDIEEEDIRFQPVRINKRYRNNGREEHSVTSQQVSVTFNDFSIYEEIQLTLIENGFDSFNGSFSSTEMDDGKDNALETAIEKAHEKAAFIAEVSNVKLGDVLSANYSEHIVSGPSPLMEADAIMVRSASASMMDFGQTVSVSVAINMVFEIDD